MALSLPPLLCRRAQLIELAPKCEVSGRTHCQRHIKYVYMHAYKHMPYRPAVWRFWYLALPECLCRSATAFRCFLCDLTRLELHLHGPGGRGRPGENRPAPLRHGVQDEEPERTQRSEKQAVLSSSSSEVLHWIGVPEAQLWMETIKQNTISISTTQTRATKTKTQIWMQRCRHKT